MASAGDESVINPGYAHDDCSSPERERFVRTLCEEVSVLRNVINAV